MLDPNPFFSFTHLFLTLALLFCSQISPTGNIISNSFCCCGLMWERAVLGKSLKLVQANLVLSALLTGCGLGQFLNASGLWSSCES